MYCYKCGKELSDDVRFCPNCGAQQNKAGNQTEELNTSNNSGKFWRIFRKVIAIVIVVPLIVLGLLAVIGFMSDDNDEEIQEQEAVQSAAPVATAPPEKTTATEAQVLEDGWHTENGERYYISDGLLCVDLQEIDGELYYFNEDGTLAVNEEVRYGESTLEADRDGRIEAITYDAIYGEWADESYRFGNGGSSSVREFSSDIENCDSFRFYLESHGERGAKVNGKWKLYIRQGGSWVFVKNFDYTQPSGYINVKFHAPVTFDAITAYPTVQGNATYSSLFYLTDVHCLF